MAVLIVLVACALIITGLIVRREIRLSATANADTPFEEVDDWERLAETAM